MLKFKTFFISILEKMSGMQSQFDYLNVFKIKKS